jgi:hypothetical protein
VTACCPVCGSEFEGRADAVYCRPGCRQRAYRARRDERVVNTAEVVAPRPPVSELVSVSASALVKLLGALAYTRQRIERAMADGAVPAWDRYYWLVADASEALRGWAPCGLTAPGAISDALSSPTWTSE